MSINSSTTKKTLKNLETITGSELSLGKLVWAIRSADDLTQVEFAKTLGVSQQHLCDIEHDRKIVSPKLAAEYAKKLGYSVEQFIRLSLQAMVDRDNLKA